MKVHFLLATALCVVFLFSAGSVAAGGYPIVDTGQNACFDDTSQIRCPEPGQPFDGQDAQFGGNQPAYRDNGDGTVSDLVTGLMWVRARGDKVGWQEAMDGATACRVGGYDDWRAPTIKELYSLIDFNGWVQGREQDSVPYIDTRYFEFSYGDTASGERVIDCQDWSSTSYQGTTMGNSPTAFGVNFADGRIKGYPKERPGPAGGGRGTSHYIRYVRGNPAYGKNDFVSGGDGTVTDRATGLVWQQADRGKPCDWKEALSYCRNLDLAGHTDWRLPNVKELQSLVDYSRGPASTGVPALDPVFSVSDPESYFWSSTTHLDGPRPSRAAYVAFGRAMGYFSAPRSNSGRQFMDVHGAGAQRSDPKSGDPSRYADGHGPQGDDVRISNHVRCVRGGGVEYREPPYASIPDWKGGMPGGAGGQSMNMDGQSMNRGGQDINGQGMGGQSVGGVGQGMDGQGMNRGGQDINGQGMGGQSVGGVGQGMDGQGMNGGARHMQGQRMAPASRGKGMGMAPGRRSPPPEARKACSGVLSGSDCAFQSPRGTVRGVCREHDGGLACIPAGGAPQKARQ